MTISVEWVRYGRPAAEALRAAIAAVKGDQPLAPVTVVVASNHVGVAARRLLASGTLGPVSSRGVGLAATTFVTPYRLAELLGASRLASAGRRPVSTPIIAAALRQALATHPGVFAPVAAHPATETALVSAYRELRDLHPAALARLAACSPRANDVVRLHRAARSHIEARWYDEEDLMTAAGQRMTQQLPADAFTRHDLAAVVLYLPQRLSEHAAALLRAVASLGQLIVLAGLTGDRRADLEVTASVTRLDASRAGSLPPPVDAMSVVAIERTRLVTTSDAEEEVRAAVRAIVDAARANTPLDRIAVLHASPQPYGRLLHEHLNAAGIAVNGAAVMPLTARVAGRTVIDLLALPEGNFRRQDVFAWLAGGPILHDGRPAPVASWERLSRRAGVVAGRDHWDQLLADLADRLDLDADKIEADPDEPEWKAERDRADARRARQLRTFLLHLIDDLADVSSRPRRWTHHADWARRHLTVLLGADTRRDRWPPLERGAAGRVDRALDRLATLDDAEGPVEIGVFARTLLLELENDLGRVGRLGEGVLVGSVQMGIGLDLDLVITLGLAEGTFPASVHDDSLLPDHERESTGGALPLRTERIDRDHRALLAALAGASKQLLCMPRGDLRRSSERVPSRWALDIASALVGQRVSSADLLDPELGAARADAGADIRIEHTASFDAGLRHLDSPATEQEHRLRSLLSGGLVSATDATLGRGAEVIAARRSASFTRFDGNLAGLPIPSPVDHVTSATRLELWAGCPFAYLQQYLLGIAEVENPEDELRISALDKGSLVHEILERFIIEVLARPPDQQRASDQPWTEDDLDELVGIADEVCDRYEVQGLTGRPIFWRRDRAKIVADLSRFLDKDSAHRQATGTRPVAAELAFGFGRPPVGGVPLRLPDGRVVTFRGKADRVDVAAGNQVHVVDYKTGKTTAFKKVNETNPDLQGQKLQLAVYGEAARLAHGNPESRVRAEYWFVSARGGFERIGYEVTPDILDRVRSTVGVMVSGIESGVFPNYTTDMSTSPIITCAYCDPDRLGVVELRGRWHRKRADPALRIFADLAEPPSEGDDEDEGGIEGNVAAEAPTHA